MHHHNGRLSVPSQERERLLYGAEYHDVIWSMEVTIEAKIILIVDMNPVQTGSQQVEIYWFISAPVAPFINMD